MDALESAAVQEKRRIVCFYIASVHGGVCPTSSVLRAVPSVLWHGFTHSVQPGLVEQGDMG